MASSLRGMRSPTTLLALTLLCSCTYDCPSPAADHRAQDPSAFDDAGLPSPFLADASEAPPPSTSPSRQRDASTPPPRPSHQDAGHDDSWPGNPYGGDDLNPDAGEDAGPPCFLDEDGDGWLRTCVDDTGGEGCIEWSTVPACGRSALHISRSQARNYGCRSFYYQQACR